MFNSGNIRRQIGIVKKRLLQQCELIQQLLLDYNVQKKQPVFEQLSNDEIAEFRRDLTEAHFQLHRSYSKIQQLHDSWSDARNADRKEEEVYADYINKYGDYTKAVQEAVTSLENADEILNAVDAEFMKRHLPIPADREDNTSILQKASADLHNNSNLKVETDSRTNPHHRDQTIGQAAATMNFVDASILSRLDLPTFDGNLLEYAEFFARFRALIGDKKQLDDATKFSLLKSCLKGRALQSIQGLALTGQNYHIALDILKSRYDDKVTTRHILFSQLANLPSCDPEGKHLQSLYNKMFSLTRQFCSYEDDSKEIALGAILLNKLPRYVRSKIYDRTGNTHNLAPSELLDVLTDIVHKESTLQEIDFHCKRFHQQHEEGYVGVQKQQKRSTPFNPSNRSSSETRSSPNKRTKFRKCSFCESIQHNTFTCTKFITPQQRAQVVRDKRLCFNCLSSKHRTRECLSNRCCQNCAKRHHTSICNLPKRQEPGRPSRLPVHDKTTQRQERKSQVHFVDDSMQDAIDKDSNIKLQRNSDVVAALHDSRIPSAKQVLMMCTEVNVFNPSNPSKSTKTMAFLDSGSSKSYITTDLAKFLELPEDEKGEISMYTFGTSEATPFPVTLHTIGMYTSKGRRFLDVRALRTLTKELQTITFTDESIDELQWTTISRKPSLLIGSDYFWEILLSEEFYVKNLSNGYHLVHSSIGDIVTGKPLPTLKNSDYCYNSLPMSNETLDTLVHRFWDLETEGVVDSPRTAEDDECLRKQSKRLFQKAGMNLRQYCSNSRELNEFFTEEEKSVPPNNNKILGISWNMTEDTLSIQLPTIPAEESNWTKRKVLKAIASTYDPLGLCSPALFSSKVFLQSLWKECLSWDQTLPSELMENWKTITSKWTSTTFTIPRQVTTGTKSSLFEIHVFSDASVAGYCAVAYIVEISETRKSSLLMSKTRLAPLKDTNGSQLLKHISKNLDMEVTKTIIWSDSSVALTWIKTGKDLPLFIRNRVKSIRENAPDTKLRYVPSKDNPADVGSRGANADDLQNFQLWWKGPDFLSQPENMWPVDITSDPAVHALSDPAVHALHAEEEKRSPCLIDTTRFSTWKRLVRTMYTILLFLTKKSAKARQVFGQSPSMLFDKAAAILFRFAQEENPPSSTLKKQLQLYKCNTLWRSKGRISNADLPQETTTPIFLPRKNYVTSLYILHIHQENHHSGVNQTLCEVRRNVWIPKGRTTVKRVINNSCYHCKRYKARPFMLPEFPAHPERRVRKPQYPFENCGMDSTGPLFLKNDENTNLKYWIILLTYSLSCSIVEMRVIKSVMATDNNCICAC
ncbi:Pao retrotransposon peptidase [Ostertagia ostertagi]